MMDMHGMFFDFPKTFSVNNSNGLNPIGSHLRYIPDFCDWDGRLVLATDETSIQGNRLAGQPQSNLWFGSYEDLKSWGPASGYGGPWVDDEVQANTWSDPFLVAGFERRMLHLAAGRKKPALEKAFRATDQQPIKSMPHQLATLPRVTVRRGDWHKPAPGYAFEVNHPVTVFMAVDVRGNPNIDAEWKKTKLELRWGKNHRDQIYRRDFPAGMISIPPNETEHAKGSFGMPHTAFISSGAKKLEIKPGQEATLTRPSVASMPIANQPVTFAIQVDKNGTNKWTDFSTVSVAGDSAKSIELPRDLNAVWMRFKTDRDCIATAFLHQTSAYPIIRQAKTNSEEIEKLFSGLAEVGDENVVSGNIYAAKRNRNLRMITSDDRFFEFRKNRFEFKADPGDEKLKQLLHVEPDFTVDEASVIIESQDKRYRLPKGNAAYDRPFTSGWPRATREVESERELANIHGTFYELPLITNGAPPAWNLMRPVSSHNKQITDFCSWNGLLVLSGVKNNAANDGHVFRDSKLGIGLWFGGIDDLWKLGKPVGRGGPWKNTSVEPGVPSDPYLMRGYDEKFVALHHKSDDTVTITLEIDINGEGLWVKYKSFELPPDTTGTFNFPKSFSACWVRAVSNARTTATVQFSYK